MKKILLLIVLFSQYTFSQFLEKKEDLKKYEGYFDFYYNPKADEIYLEVDKSEKESMAMIMKLDINFDLKKVVV